MGFFRITIFWVLLTPFLISIQASKGNEYHAVSKVVDGDTFWVKYSNGTEAKIRLIGINSPEARNTGKTQIEYFGKESSEFARKILTGRKVRIVYDVQKYDRYKRHLAYVYLEDGTFLNALLVKEGYANVATYPPNVKYVELFTKLEREARSKRKGLWAK